MKNDDKEIEQTIKKDGNNLQIEQLLDGGAYVHITHNIATGDFKFDARAAEVNDGTVRALTDIVMDAVERYQKIQKDVWNDDGKKVQTLEKKSKDVMYE